MRVLIIGSGAKVESELAQINRADFDAVIGVNRAARLYPPVDIHISLHPHTYAERKIAHFVAHMDLPGVDEVFDYQWPGCQTSGSSGLYAVKYALERLHADAVVLCGVGMEVEPHIYTSNDWQGANRYREAWEVVEPILRGRVTSMGGWTAQLLGQPVLSAASAASFEDQ